jgi:hypothetical protein
MDCDTFNANFSLPNISFWIGNQTDQYKLDIRPNTYLMDITYQNKDACMLSVNSTLVKDPPIYVFGDLFLKDYYTVFDLESSQIGFIGIQYVKPKGGVKDDTD